MKNFHKFILTILSSSVLLTGCELTEEDEQKVRDAQVDLEQIADQILITYPANDAVIDQAQVTLRADIPAAAEAQEVILYVDGIEVGKDSDGAPWEIQWPAYYWGDDKKHTLLLKTITKGGNEVRNNDPHQVEILSSVNNALSFSGSLNGTTIQDSNSYDIEFNSFTEASKYEIKVSSESIGYLETFETEYLTLLLTDLEVASYDLTYRAIFEYSESTTLIGPWSETATIEVIPPVPPILNEPEIEFNNNIYSTTLSWDETDADNVYELFINNLADDSLSNSYSNLEENELSVDFITGEYELSLKVTNKFNHESELSSVTSIFVGTPDAPLLELPESVEVDDKFNINISWNESDLDETYEINVKDLYDDAQSFSISDLETNEYQLEVNTGGYEISVKVINNYGKESGFSNVREIFVGNLDAPILETPNIELIENSYNVNLTWNETDENNIYELNIENLDDDSLSYSIPNIENSSHQFELAIGVYEVSVKLSNSYNHDSIFSETQLLEVGTFNKTFGGTSSDRMEQFFKTKDGGYIIRASTESRDINNEIDSLGDDWFIKLDSKGNQEWEYFSHAEKQKRFKDITELNDGSFVAVGRDLNESKAVALKINPNGEIDWEVFYETSIDVDYTSFEAVIEFNDELYVSTTSGCYNSGCTINKVLNTFSIENGEFSLAIPISYSESVISMKHTENTGINTMENLSITKNGKLLLSGRSNDDDDDYSDGVYFAILNSELEIELIWSNTGKYENGSFGDILELDENIFAVIGRDYHESFPVLTIVDTNLLTDSTEYIDPYHSQFDSSFSHYSTISINENNDIYLIYQRDDNAHIATYTSNLTLLKEYSLELYDTPIGVGIIYNNDETITFALNHGGDFTIIKTKYKN